MLRPTRSVLPLVSVLLLALPLPGTAQQEPPAAEFEEEVEVTEVLLDVLVTDQDGRVVVGLDGDDFVVEEDGEPVDDLTSVTFYSNSRFLESDATEMAKDLEVDRVPVDRYFILFFHDQRLQSAPVVRAERQQLDAGRKARTWVREEMLPTDWVAVVSYRSKLNIHQDFSHDKEALVAALESAPVAESTSGNWPSRIDEEAGPSLRAHLPRGKELARQTRTIYDALELVGEAARPVLGRKNLIMFTRGFGEVNRFGLYEPDARYYEPMRRTLNDANVAVYTVDTTPVDVSHDLESALAGVATDTGGRYHFNFVDFLGPLREIAEENTGYYLLSYESRHPRGESGYQEVSVDTTNPDFEVGARHGYLYGEEGSR